MKAILGRKIGMTRVFKDGVASRKDYRRFRIKTVSTPNDAAAVEEVVRRRYLRLKEEGRILPDLVVIDGGRPQVYSANKQAERLGINICIIGLAKKKEQVWVYGKDKPLDIPLSCGAVKMLQKVRDEAHRFAHNYHILLRTKGMFR